MIGERRESVLQDIPTVEQRHLVGAVLSVLEHDIRNFVGGDVEDELARVEARDFARAKPPRTQCEDQEVFFLIVGRLVERTDVLGGETRCVDIVINQH